MFRLVTIAIPTLAALGFIMGIALIVSLFV